MGVLEDLVSCSKGVFVFSSPGSILKNHYSCFRLNLRAYVWLNIYKETFNFCFSHVEPGAFKWMISPICLYKCWIEWGLMDNLVCLLVVKREKCVDFTWCWLNQMFTIQSHFPVVLWRALHARLNQKPTQSQQSKRRLEEEVLFWCMCLSVTVWRV